MVQRGTRGFEEVPVGDPGWSFVERENCMVMLGRCPDAVSPRDMKDHSYYAYLKVDDVEAFHQRARDASAEVWHEIKDQPWGMREFALVTPGGHRIMVGQKID